MDVLLLIIKVPSVLKYETGLGIIGRVCKKISEGKVTNRTSVKMSDVIFCFIGFSDFYWLPILLKREYIFMTVYVTAANNIMR